jgi:hypothetical protein
MPTTAPTPSGKTGRTDIALRLRIGDDLSVGATYRGRRVIAVTLPSARFVLALLAMILVVAVAVPVGGTQSLLSATTSHPGNDVQANTVRLVGTGDGSPAFAVPALMPGESVDRTFGITSTGTGDARLDLVVVPDGSGPLVTDLASGLSLTVDRCLNGTWATTTPVTGVPTPLAAGAQLACAVTPGAVPSVQALYQGPIVPRGAVGGAATPTPQAIALANRIVPGDRAEFRARVSLPALPPATTPAADRQGAVSFEWRATGLGSNLAGTPLMGAPAPPAVATATATGLPSATATATALATATTIPTATATASPTATLSPYGGTALAFDGLVDAMQIGWTEAVGPLSGRSAWTFEAWVNPADLSTPRVIYAEAAATGDALAIRLAPGSSGTTRLEVGLRHAGALEWSGATVASGTMAVGAWSHVAVAYDAGVRLDLAVNGATIASLATTAATTAPDVVPVTSRVARPGDATTGAPFAGIVDEVRAWSLARTYAVTDTTFAQKLLGSEPGLILHFPMGAYAAAGNDAKGITLLDQSPSAITATLSGGVRWVPSRAPVDRPATPRDLRLAAGSDVGASATDRITNQTMVTMTGTGSPGSVIALFVNGVASPYSGTVSSNGTFYVSAYVTSGVPEVTARAIGTTNLPSMTSATATFTVDTTLPVPGTITAATIEGSPVVTLAGASDTGHPGAGLATAQLQVAVPSPPTVVFEDIGSPVSLPSSGGATLTVPASWAGFNRFRIAVTDVAGNIAFTAPINIGTDNVPPTVSILTRYPVTDVASVWNQPTFRIPAVDIGGIGSVTLQVDDGAGNYADTGTTVLSGTFPTTLGDVFVVRAVGIPASARNIRARVTDLAGNSVYSNAIFVSVWTAEASDVRWTTAGNAAFVGGWLRFTANTYGDNRDYDQRGGALLASPVPVGGAFTVGFDMKATGIANGTCVVLLSNASSFTSFLGGSTNGGDSLGCIGMPGAVAFAGIDEYGSQTIRLGPTLDPVSATYGVEDMSGVRYYAGPIATNTLVNTADDVRITILVQPYGSVTRLEVYTQVGTNASPTLRMSRTVSSGTLPANGTYLGITGAVGWASAEHKVRNIAVMGY